MKKMILASILFLSWAARSEARIVGIQMGVGNWYSDDLRSSYQYGGGLLLKPGVQWLEFTATFDRAPANLKTSDRWTNELKGKTLNFYRLGLTFPSRLEAMGLQAYLFPLLAYVVTSNADKITHGFGLGGGLEFLVWKEILGARFEALEQMYKIPTASGQTGFQEDFFFALRITASY